ncbi:tetratricopeptide repeat protein [Pseudoalteromonas ruthenica]|uniref:Cytochrome c-552/4 domain-containing protein n=1 Tax=Pseudoalteromonas ruthenica TaxID=151081 RepID=A0A0F4PZ13_9GAMM|nr:tetratricopeptide repeat protein [Pseudoalteromonas ruthenica]KJY95814.1 hypothetical protein TW76_14730 [Pseudoalteromonas ruthenica]KJZ00299.1 hypothetical protein TW72_06220 [Pseudoalteromonas ruthenica]TMO90759.1 tetratricopeptide repeat protein [Pseudoalteromonas ruthenica]TMP00996.1 tetratricopeptide repeat protein [Pseudoalteromonas ruthenica]TMP09774.1 tetratricopeptide repeat protein [Pseudoalteromonas ruthenica]
MDLSKLGKWRIVGIALVLFTTLVFADPKQCANCHQQQVMDWQQSDHANAMALAIKETALGAFDNRTLAFQNQQAIFKQRNAQLIISMPDLQGRMRDIEVTHTFGHFPLQQYMFASDNGQLQFFPFAWDSRPKAQGGQRWFVLHPEQQPHDEFHYSQKGQNWNHMCADCHSSDFEKRYLAKQQQFDSRYSAINVGCASCHGDSQAHLAWAKGDKTINDKGYEHTIGVKTPLFERQTDGSMKAASPLRPSSQVAVCATCHARRSQVADRQGPHSFMDSFQPALLEPELYHVDGQIWDENYVWGSFVQSKMHQAGVTCANCHNPHSGKLTLPGNQTCTQCHTAEVFDTAKHHGHKHDTEGSQCVDCHMPATTFMQVDARRDHSFRVPRPDLTAKTQAPNACNGCHQDKTPQWATSHIKRWHPNSNYLGTPHFSEAFYAADNDLPSASAMLTKIAQDKSYPNIVRASALARMADQPDRNAVVAIVRAVRDDDPLKRQGAIAGARNFAIAKRHRMLQPLLTDPRLPIRAEAGRALAEMLTARFAAQLSDKQRLELEDALKDYRQMQHYQAERGYSHTNLGNLARSLGEHQQAEQHYLDAIAVEPIFIPAYVNLADLYRALSQEQKARTTIEQGLSVNKNAPALHYALAMSLVRSGQKQQALSHLARAAQSNNSDYVYTYALLLQDRGQHQEALVQLNNAFALTPANPDISYSLMQLHAQQKQYRQAYRYAQQLQQLLPDNPQIAAMVEKLAMMQQLQNQ